MRLCPITPCLPRGSLDLPLLPTFPPAVRSSVLTDCFGISPTHELDAAPEPVSIAQATTRAFLLDEVDDDRKKNDDDDGADLFFGLVRSV